jgi:protein-S-isoprenylcysteine O-methyltransferase Ste14
VTVHKQKGAVGSVVFFIVGPGVVVGLVPWLLTGWKVQKPLPCWMLIQVLGWLLIAAGLIVLVHSFILFFVEGLGTPVPLFPPERLVIGGLYRYARNPMYVALLAVIIGQGMVLGQLILLLYAVIVWLVTAAWVRWYEEPALTRRFGADYEAYRSAVPAWWPHLTPWHLGEL